MVFVAHQMMIQAAEFGPNNRLPIACAFCPISTRPTTQYHHLIYQDVISEFSKYSPSQNWSVISLLGANPLPATERYHPQVVGLAEPERSSVTRLQVAAGSAQGSIWSVYGEIAFPVSQVPRQISSVTETSRPPAQRVRLSRNRKTISCMPCKVGKIKCSRRRPECDSCAAGSKHCTYEDDTGSPHLGEMDVTPEALQR